MNIDFKNEGDVLQLDVSFGLTKAGTDLLYATKAELAAETSNRTAADTAEVTARNNAIAASAATLTTAINNEAAARAAADTAEVTARNQAIATHAAAAASTYETKAHALATYLANAFIQITDGHNTELASADNMKIYFIGKNGVKVEIDKANATIVFDGSSLEGDIASKLSATTAAQTYATIASLVNYMQAGFAKIKLGNNTGTAGSKTAAITFADAGGIELSLNTTTNTLTIDGSSIKSIALAAIPSPAIEGSNGDVLCTDGNGGRQWRTPVTDMVRTSQQTLSYAAKQQARANIDAASDSSVGILNNLHTRVKTDLVSAINEIADTDNERVSVTITPSEGSIEGFIGSSLSILISQMTDAMSVPMDANGNASFLVPKGHNYTITYPTYVGYLTPSAETFSAAKNTRTIVKVYTISAALEDVATSIVLEESSNPQWTRGGNMQAIAQIVSTYGSYVIDPVHHKYAQLSSTDGAKFADGTAWTGTYGEAFRRFPSVFYDVITENGVTKLWMSKRGISAKKFDEMWVGTYKGNVSDNKLHSRPNVAATGSKTMSQFWQYAQNLGTDFGLVNYFDHCYLNALHLLTYGDANSEHTMGAGLQSAGSAYYNATTGATISLGDATGSHTYGSTAYSQNKLFGIEALAGQQYEFRPNIRFSGSDAIVYSGNIVSNTIAEGDPAFVRQFTRGTSSGWTKKMQLGAGFDMIPIAVGGGDTTYYCDYYYYSAGGQLLLVGGSSGYGSYCGLSCAYADADFGDALAAFGSRLAFRGNIGEYELITGAEMAAINASGL